MDKKAAVAYPTRQPIEHHGRPNAQHDDMTPECAVCQTRNVGMHTPCTAMLKGQFVLSPEHGMSMFVVDPDADIAAVVLPTGQLGLMIAPNAAANIIHDCCFQTLLTEVGLAGMDDEEDDADDDCEDEGFHDD